MFSRCNSRMADGVVALIGSATPSSPASLPSAHKHHGVSVCSHRLPPHQRPVSTPNFHNRRLPRRTTVPPHSLDALSVPIRSVRRRAATHRAFRSGHNPAASGCSLAVQTRRHCSSRASSTLGPVSPTPMGLTHGQCSRLIHDQGVDLAHDLDCLGVLNSRPTCAFACRTMIDIGVARPSAHGRQ